MAVGEPQGEARAERIVVGEERERLIAGFSKAMSEHGYAGLEVEQVLHHAQVPRRTFDVHFASKEQGLIAAQDVFLERLWLDVMSACDGPGEWPLKVRAALMSILSSLTEADGLARVFAVEATAVSLVAAERQFATLDRLAQLLRDGRRHFPRAAALPAATERALVGGIASIISGHLLLEEMQAISAQEGQLLELLLIPYVGEGEARRVAGAEPAPAFID